MFVLVFILRPLTLILFPYTTLFRSLHVAADRKLELTEEGLNAAATVMRKHRLAERLLSDIIGLDWPYVHDEACRWEHRSEEHTSELQSRGHLVCRLLLEKKKLN